MQETKQHYAAPTLRASGAVVEATRAGVIGIAEPVAPFLPRDHAGQLGFGL